MRQVIVVENHERPSISMAILRLTPESEATQIRVRNANHWPRNSVGMEKNYGHFA